MTLCVKLTLISLLLVAVTACQTSPTGRPQLLLVSSGDMGRMGAASFIEMKKKNPPSTGKADTSYVQCLSQLLLQAAGENPEIWEIQVFNDASPNAFALPGRKIGVNTGMLDLAGTPAQLAAVIGHEIGHVQARHGAERLSINMASQTAQQISAIAVEGTEYGAVAMAAIGIGAQYGVLLPYSRTHESEADYIGLNLMAKAGFDPQQSVVLWQTMSKAGGKKQPEFLSTHPANETRIRELRAAMDEAKKHYQQVRITGQTPRCTKPK